MIKILAKRKGAEILLVAFGEFPDTDAPNFAPRSCDTFGPFQNVYETYGTCLLQCERLCQTENADRRLYL